MKPKTKAKQTPPSIVMVATADLIPYARNSRTHSEEQVAQIAGSIREFGFTNPVLIDAKNSIIAGHGRVMAAQNLELGEVPCIRLTHLTETQKKAYIIADNRLALNAGWDEKMLTLEITDLMDDKFDLGFLGFDEAELAALMAGEEDIDLPPGDPEPPNYEVIAECSSLTEQKLIQQLLKKKGIPTRIA